MSNIKPKFSLGRTLATPGLLEVMQDTYGKNADDALFALFVRHATGDWGNLDNEDRAANEDALRTGARIFSAYNMPVTPRHPYERRVWIITEADREATTALLPEEY